MCDRPLAAGAGIFNADSAILFLTGSTVTGNQALGGSNNTSTGNGDVGSATGGGLWNIAVATVTDSRFEDNEARGGSGNRGDGTSFQLVGTATGGGIATAPYNVVGDPARLTLRNVVLRGNRAVGGDGNTDGTFRGTAWGGGLASSSLRPSDLSGGSTTTVSNTTIADNQAVGGAGRDALGGAIANLFGSELTVSGSTLTGNQAVGGAGGSGGKGGSGEGGGIFNGGPSTAPTNLDAPTLLTVLDSRIAHNEAEGGAGSTGGDGLGGGLYVADSRSDTVTVTVADSRTDHNEAEGADGGGGRHHHDNDGRGLGGGVYIAGGTVCITDTTIKHNHADTSDDNVFGVFGTDC